MKKLAYITGSRAEYGIVKRLLLKLQEDNNIDFSVIVTGMHLDQKYGSTINNLVDDGINISEVIPIHLDSINNQMIIESMSECLDKFGKFFQHNRYDAIIVLGDRYEIFAVAIAAAIHNIPIIHLHGGEQTLGNYDEFIRHSITKMSKLHLVSTEEYRTRVIQLGESPNSVINIGSLGAENSLLLSLPSIRELNDKYNILISKNYFVIVFHPETLTNLSIEDQIDELLLALDFFKDMYSFIFIGANADTGSNIIYNKVKRYVKSNNFLYFTSLKTEEYLSLVKNSLGLIGNSSSGLIEVPSLKVPTINLGDRQLGRVKGKSVIDSDVKKENIISAIKYSQSNEFQAILKNSINPYRKENSLEIAYTAIVDFLNSTRILELKSFWDIDYGITKR